MFPTLDLNVQFGCCFAVFIVWFLCLFPLRHAQAKAQGGLNNSDPRRQYGEIDGYGRRALAAHNNTLEGFVFFSFTLVANYFGNGHQTAASILAVIYAICRVIYAPLYIMDYPSLRSAVWMVSLLCIMSLFILPFATPATPGFVLSYNY